MIWRIQDQNARIGQIGKDFVARRLLHEPRHPAAGIHGDDAAFPRLGRAAKAQRDVRLAAPRAR